MVEVTRNKLEITDWRYITCRNIFCSNMATQFLFCILPVLQSRRSYAINLQSRITFISDPSFELKEDEDTDDTLESNSDPDFVQV